MKSAIAIDLDRWTRHAVVKSMDEWTMRTVSGQFSGQSSGQISAEFFNEYNSDLIIYFLLLI